MVVLSGKGGTEVGQKLTSAWIIEILFVGEV